MTQEKDDMMFCAQCKMNVFPNRPELNMIAFGICAAIIFIPAILLTILLPFTSYLFFIYFMWGFMILNPYLIIYGLQKKHYCPRCHGKCIEKNLEYQPFGSKEPEPFKHF